MNDLDRRDRTPSTDATGTARTPLRTLFILPRTPEVPVGGYAVVYEYANRLVKRGHLVTVLHVDELGRRRTISELFAGATRRSLTRPAAVDWFPVAPEVELLSMTTLGRGTLRHHDVAVATSWLTAECLGRLLHPRRGARGAYLIQHHEIWAGPEERVNATWRLPLTKVVIASWLEDVATSLGAGPVYQVPNAIDLSRFRVLRPIPGRPTHVSMLWHDQPWKGSDEGLRAIALAKLKLPALRATLFGTGLPPDPLPEWARYVRSASAEELLDIYNDSAVFLSPSHTEGWPLPPAESMSCGAALLSTDIPGVRDYARDGITARLVPVGDVEAMATALVDLLLDDVRRSELAVAGHRLVNESFDWELSADRMDEILRLAARCEV